MKNILFWILPPLVGAFIGYVTNAVAIKMLFRPLAEKRLFGLRLPFTPGILPRERKKLAESIGRMVEQELLTPGVLRDRLAKAEVRGNVENALALYTDQLLERPVSYWLDEERGEFPPAELFNNFVSSEVFNSFLEELVKNWICGTSAPDETEGNFALKIKSRFRDLGSILVPPARDLIKSGLVKGMKKQSGGKGSIYRLALESIIEKYPNLTTKEFLSVGVGEKRKVDTFLAGKTVDTLDENIEGALSSVNVRVLVSDRINSLDMLRVEKIILEVVSGQLKWINFFGAILGALIGFLEVLYSFFTG